MDNLCYVTIAVNSKEYFKVFKNQKANKKHKGIKKGSHDMEFNNFAGRIKSLVHFDTFQKPPSIVQRGLSFHCLPRRNGKKK